MQSIATGEQDKYPLFPGFQDELTSFEAAVKIKPQVKELHTLILAELAKWNMTADEMASHLKVGILTMRPRYTELKKMGLIVKTGNKRKNASGGYGNEMRLAIAPPPPGTVVVPVQQPTQ